MKEISISGGEKMERVLRSIAERVATKDVLKVGFLRGADYATGLHIAQVAFWNEYGTSRAPARPFMRQTVSANSSVWGDHLGKFLKANDYRANHALGLLGHEVKDDITESIQAWPADNAPLTVKKKGFNHGLIDTGTMMRSVDFEVGGGSGGT